MPKSRYSMPCPQRPSADKPPDIVVRHLNPCALREPVLRTHLVQWLSDHEQQQLAKFTQPSVVDAYLAAHALKRGLLGQLLACPPQALQFESAQKGKPFIAAPNAGAAWHFNLSHTPTMVAVAVSREPIGIDVEDMSRRPPNMAVAKRYFAPREYARIAASPQGEQIKLFFQYWTLKEAFLKAEGWGLSQRLAACEFDLSGDITLVVLDPIAQPTRAWRFWQQQLTDSHLVSVALVAGASTVESAIDCRPWQRSDWRIT